MLELIFDVEPDTYGVIDGRELASALVQTAYALLTPYVEACPACADDLFSAVANTAIQLMHQEDNLPSRTMCVAEDPDGARWRKHLASTQALTNALLGASSPTVH